MCFRISGVVAVFCTSLKLKSELIKNISCGKSLLHLYCLYSLLYMDTKKASRDRARLFSTVSKWTVEWKRGRDSPENDLLSGCPETALAAAI